MICLSSVGAFFALQAVYGDELYSIYGLCVLVAFMAWFIADMFTDVLAVGVSAVLQCYLIDEETFGAKSEHCPKEMRGFFKEVEIRSLEKHRESGSASTSGDEHEGLEVQREEKGCAIA